jgi:hypothetical protein
MWPLAIEFTDEFVEACLLLKKRPSGWSGCFLLQFRCMLDAFERDSEPEPEDRKREFLCAF